MQVFTESEVRASLVFQLSKLCSLLLKAARLAVGGAEWDALVAGTTLQNPQLLSNLLYAALTLPLFLLSAFY